MNSTERSMEELILEIEDLKKWRREAMPLIHAYVHSGARTFGGAEVGERLLAEVRAR